MTGAVGRAVCWLVGHRASYWQAVAIGHTQGPACLRCGALLDRQGRAV